MPKTVCSKVYKSPRRPYEKSRMDQEMKLIGQYGLKNKREVWRAKYTLAKIRQAARYLLTLPQTDERRSFEGNSLLRRLVRMGLMSDADMKLDMVLYLKLNDLFERRLQTQVFRLGIAKSVHHARVLIRHRHISVRKQLVNVPSYIVREESRSHIGFALNSSLAGGRPGRVACRKQKQAEGGGEEEGSQE